MRRFFLYLSLVVTLVILGAFGIQTRSRQNTRVGANSSESAPAIYTDSFAVYSLASTLTSGDYPVVQAPASELGTLTPDRTLAVITYQEEVSLQNVPSLTLTNALDSDSLSLVAPSGLIAGTEVIDAFLKKNLSDYRSRQKSKLLSTLEDFDEDYRDTLGNCERDVLITTLPNLTTFGRKYNLAVLVLGTDPIDADQNERYLRAQDLRDILYSPQADNSPFQRFLRNSDYTLLDFHPLDSPDSPKLETALRTNLQSLRTTLRCVE